jgi:hypothetical protein
MRERARVRLTMALAAAVAPISNAALAVVLGVDLIPQRGSQWCWAASAEMAHDFAFPGKAKEVGQCTLAKQALTGCACAEADDPPGAGCDEPNLFASDFMGELLDTQGAITYHAYTPEPISPELLKCEVNDRLSPVVFWWKDVTCSDSGHLAVASGYEPSEVGDLVLVLDPWPKSDTREKGGERYWLSWRGFACGRLGGGHCAAYFKLPKEQAPMPDPCDDVTQRRGTACFAAANAVEQVKQLSELDGRVELLLNGTNHDVIRGPLGIPLAATVSVDCDTDTILREAIPAIEDNRSTFIRTRRTKVLCTATVGGTSHQLSVMLFDPKAETQLLNSASPLPTSFVFGGLGSGAWTDWLSANSRVLDRNTSEPFAVRELVELFVPGRGQMALIEELGTGARRTIRFGDIVSEPRDWEDVLGDRILADPGFVDDLDPLDDLDPRTFEGVLRDWSVRDHIP